MRQLTKAPCRAEELRADSADDAVETTSNPTRYLSRFQMGRYLDYCSEMLSLTGKISAPYGDDFGDAEAVNAVEALTLGLQRKIWQKMRLLSNGSSSASSP